MTSESFSPPPFPELDTPAETQARDRHALALGVVLRQLRQHHGWTRHQMIHATSLDISVPTHTALSHLATLCGLTRPQLIAALCRPDQSGQDSRRESPP